MKQVIKLLRIGIIVNVLLTLGIQNAYNQDPDDDAYKAKGAMVISDDKSELGTPDPSAMLDIRSKTKGVIISHMSFANMNIIKNPADGLMVYITDNDKKGYWYWNASTGHWKKIDRRVPDKGVVVAPSASIIMYSGELFETIDGVQVPLFNSQGIGHCNTKMEGWQVCNGYCDSPDLRGKFIMPNDNEGEGDASATNILEIDLNQMHRHDHALKAPDSKQLTPHKHATNPDNKHGHTVSIAKRKFHRGKQDNRNLERRMKGTELSPYLDKETLDVEIDLTIEEHSYSRIFPMETADYPVLDGNEDQRYIDNRPPFYVMLFIMKHKKIEDGGCNCETYTP